MKKILVILIVIVVFGVCYYYLRPMRAARTAQSPIRSGIAAADLTLGFSDSREVRLSALTGKNVIALCFFGFDSQSMRAQKELEAVNYSGYKRLNLLWFNITRDEHGYVVITEKTGNFNLTYRAHSADIPPFYSFQSLPAFMLIDRYGIISYLEVGYSPSFVRDIRRDINLLASRRI